ncbi:hypothetical protein C049_00033, partial [Brucella suis F12/02]
MFLVAHGRSDHILHCPTALLPYCPTALLPYCPTALCSRTASP